MMIQRSRAEVMHSCVVRHIGRLLVLQVQQTLEKLSTLEGSKILLIILNLELSKVIGLSCSILED